MFTLPTHVTLLCTKNLQLPLTAVVSSLQFMLIHSLLFCSAVTLPLKVLLGTAILLTEKLEFEIMWRDEGRGGVGSERTKGRQVKRRDGAAWTKGLHARGVMIL